MLAIAPLWLMLAAANTSHAQTLRPTDTLTRGLDAVPSETICNAGTRMRRCLASAMLGPGVEVELSHRQLARQRIDSSPAVVNGVVYFGSGDGNVYALNASTGAKLWSLYHRRRSVISSPAVANGVVYIGSDDDNVYALNASTGAKLWSYTTGSNVGSSPAVVNGVVYVGSGRRQRVCAERQHRRQAVELCHRSVCGPRPPWRMGWFMSARSDGNVYALNASTGAELWSYATGSAVDPRPPWRMGWFMSAQATATCMR